MLTQIAGITSMESVCCRMNPTEGDEDGPEGGLPEADTAAVVEVSIATVQRVRRSFVEDGLTAALERGCGKAQPQRSPHDDMLRLILGIKPRSVTR